MNEAMMQELLEMGVKVAGIVAAGAVVWVTAYIKQKTGIDIEAGKKVIESSNRDALDMALETAATLAFGKGLVGKAAIAFILDYLERSSPEAKAAAPASVVKDKAQAKLEKIALDEVKKVITASGGDSLMEALQRAKAWTPPPNEGRP